MESPSPTKKLISAAASAAATAVLILSITNNLIPRPIHDFLCHKFFSLFSSMSSQITVTIEELEGVGLNKLYLAAQLYLSTKISPSTHRFRAAIPAKETHVHLSMDKNQVISDVFNGVKFNWRKVNNQIQPKSKHYGDPLNGFMTTTVTEESYFEVSFHKKHQDMMMNVYLPHIVSEFSQIKAEKKTLNIHMLSTTMMMDGLRRPWVSVKLDHPATFESLAMDVDTKKMIKDDLDLFLSRKDFYRKVGKAWKRGYLLFGPPGTGKSSLIAAIANYLKFDVYDLQLTNLGHDPRSLVLSTENRSILVVEDIDCSINLDNKMIPTRAVNPRGVQPNKPQVSQVTLSSLLNFIDGLWSTCGDERIIIFTTNHKERLDQALLRPGRMDVHIHMSYYSPCGFKMLASNYLGITEHSLFAKLEELMEETKVTPAEVGEQLMKTEDPEAALRGLVEFIMLKKETEVKGEIPAEIEDDKIDPVETAYGGDAMIFPGMFPDY